ncbi:MAG TPA: GNAT family N-acetyltransferase [Terracidiphilus sp.]|nr:GNAT family N-acetyltransferase [Terracidiphilus sp.]
MFFADHALARRLEAAEGNACMQFAAARLHAFPESGAAWIKCAGADAVFDGADSPITQTFGLGVFEPLTPAALDTIEQFLLSRGAVPMHEVSPFAGAATLDLLCARGYRPFEISSVLYQPLGNASVNKDTSPHIRIRIVAPGEAEQWAAVSARGWTHEHPELEEFVRSTGRLLVARENSPCFLAELDGQPAAAAALCLHQGVALLAGAATVPEHRRNGLQAALLAERLRYAAAQGCDLAMMVTEAGSNSQRNAERAGFRVAYTRLKWKLDRP